LRMGALLEQKCPDKSAYKDKVPIKAQKYKCVFVCVCVKVCVWQRERQRGGKERANSAHRSSEMEW